MSKDRFQFSSREALMILGACALVATFAYDPQSSRTWLLIPAGFNIAWSVTERWKRA